MAAKKLRERKIYIDVLRILAAFLLYITIPRVITFILMDIQIFKKQGYMLSFP